MRSSIPRRLSYIKLPRIEALLEAVVSLARPLCFCIGLACADCSSIAGRRHAGEMLERPGKVALIKEPRCQGDFAERGIGRGNLATGKLNSLLSNVISHSAMIELAELAGEMSRMHTDQFR